MCEKCVQYDDKIARYRRLSLGINDRQTLDGIAVLIAQATDAKPSFIRLHRKSKAVSRTASHSALDSWRGSVCSTSIYFPNANGRR